MWFYFICSFTLVPFLDSHEMSREPFTKACVKLQRYTKYWTAATVILNGLKAVSHHLGVKLPPKTLFCFVEIERSLPMDPNGDIPITWAIPQHADLLEMLSDDDIERQKPTVELGLVIAKWNRMSLSE
jgi:hypothetical protein